MVGSSPVATSAHISGRRMSQDGIGGFLFSLSPQCVCAFVVYFFRWQMEEMFSAGVAKNDLAIYHMKYSWIFTSFKA